MRSRTHGHRIGFFIALLIAAGAAHADPFRVPDNFEFASEAVPGAHDRFAETLALLRDALTSDPGDAASWSRAADTLHKLNQLVSLEEPLRKAYKATAAPRQVAVGAVLGRVLVQKARTMGGNRFVIIFINGQAQPQRRDNKEAKKIAAEAIELLLAAVNADPKAARARRDLADALGIRQEENDGKDAARWRAEAAAIEGVANRVSIPAHDETATINALASRATTAEQAESPQHEEAARLRCEALVRTFCNRTIPFEYDATLFATVAQLADRGDLRRHLRRTYTDGEGNVEFVDPVLNMPSWKKRERLVRELGSRRGQNAVAALLSVAVKGQAASPLGKLACDLLSKGERKHLDGMLPALLASTLHSSRYEHRTIAQRSLVRIAAQRKLQSTQPALIAMLELDDDIWCPVGTADAIAELGIRATGPLLKIARDPHADVYFRRRAVLAIGRTEPEALNRIADEPLLALHVAAARYARTPDDALRGQILGAIGREHVTDDAAQLCAELGITEALPALETWMGDNPKHRAAPAVAEAIRALRRS